MRSRAVTVSHGIAHDAHDFSMKLIFSRNIAHELPYKPLNS